MKITLNLILLFLCSCLHAQEPYSKITVALDGSGDYISIQEAITSTRDLGPGEVEIFIKNGVYNEKIEIPSWKHQLTLKGEDQEKVIIQNGDYSGKIDEQTGKEFSTFTSYTLFVRGDDIHLENLTVKNTSCGEGQAVALHVEGDRFIAENCRFIGCQDTMYTATEASRQYYKNCYIEGTTDFIFGEATCVFEDCTIKSMRNSYITAAATPENQEFGYVFINCKLIAAEEADEVYLGRPWRSYAQTVFINTEMGEHIVKEGWNPWSGDKMFPEKEKTAYYAEYRSKGKGASPKSRVKWSHQLTKKEAEKYRLETIFSAVKNDWNPKLNQ